MQININGVARMAVTGVVGTGIGALVGNLVKQSTPSDTKKYRKVAIFVGGYVLSSMLTDAASKYVNHNIDEVVDQYKQTKEAVEDALNKKSGEPTVGEKVDEVVETVKVKASNTKKAVKDTVEDLKDIPES